MSQWPLVGRADELRRLERLLRDPSRPGVVLAGPAGAGKTRLASACLELAEAAGAATARATATHSAAAVPFGALSALLPPSDQTGAAGSDRTELLRRLVEELVGRAGKRRLVLVVDDAHLLDDASATLVHRIVETRAAFVVAVIRSGEPAPDAVVALWKDDLLERMELTGLGADAVQQLIEAMVGGPVNGAAAAFLALRSEGNALFLRELILGALEQGALSEQEGIWCLTGQPTPSIRLVELVEDRVESLSPEERTVLEYLSFAEPLGAAELGTILAADVAEQLESRGLVTSSLDGRRVQIRLAHPIYGDVLRSRIPALRSTKMARALAEVVEANGARRREDILRVASWRLTGGGGSPDLMLTAAVTARQIHDYPLAERLARFAQQAGGGFEADLLVAQLAALRGRGAEAEDRLDGLAATAATDDRRFRIAMSRVDNAYVRLQPEAQLAILAAAEAAITDPELRDQISAYRSWFALAGQGPRACDVVVGGLIDRATGHALVIASIAAGVAFAQLGRIEAGLEISGKGEIAHQSLQTPLYWGPWLHRWIRCWLMSAAGDFEEAHAAALLGYEQALAEGSAEAQAWMAMSLSGVACERGRVRTAARYAQEGAALFRQFGQALGEFHCLMVLAQAYGLAGQAEAASEALRRIDAFPSPICADLARVKEAKGWATVAGGDLPGARVLFEEAFDVGNEIGDLIAAASALHSLARIGHAKEALDRIRTVGEQVEGELTAARVAHVEALVAADPAALEQVSVRFERMGAALLAAEAAADAATVWTRKGQPRRGTASQRRSGTIVDECEGATTPAVQSVHARAHLTPAERETAILAASGRTNRQIAEQLCVSIRTIESRLVNIYAKLGVSSREDLAREL